VIFRDVAASEFDNETNLSIFVFHPIFFGFNPHLCKTIHTPRLAAGAGFFVTVAVRLFSGFRLSRGRLRGIVYGARGGSAFGEFLRPGNEQRPNGSTKRGANDD
jgi:hypothetical protein